MKKSISVILIILLVAGAVFSASAAADAPAPVVYTSLMHIGAPSGLAVASGGYYVTDTFNKVVWHYEMGKEPVRLVGRAGVIDQSGEPIGGYNDSDYAESAFGYPWDITPFLTGYLVSDSTNNVVRYFGGGIVQTAFGTGKAGYRDGHGMKAELDYPTGLSTDDEGNAYVADTGNNVIRKMTPAGEVSTFAGTGKAGHADGAAFSASFNRPTGLCWHEGALYVADTDNHVIRKIENGIVTTIAGTVYTSEHGDSVSGGDYLDGTAGDARFASPTGVAVSPDGVLYISDTGNGAVRRLEDGAVTTALKSDADRGDPYPVSPRGLLFDGETLLIADPFAGVVFTPDPAGIMGFSDVAPGSWYAGDVFYGYQKNLYKGVSETEFGPSVKVSRAMAATVIGRLHELVSGKALEGSAVFGDISDGAYYSDAVNGLAKLGIVNGDEDGNFRPGDEISRQELVAILYRYAVSVGTDDDASGSLGAFSDADKVAEWSREAWIWAIDAGIISGYEDNTLRPAGTATRAEMAKMIHVFGAQLGI